MKLDLREMRTAGKKVKEDYRRLGLKLVVTDKDGKMVMRKTATTGRRSAPMKACKNCSPNAT
jgi:hypothetical protein